MRRYKPLKDQLDKVLEKVASNIREQHQRGASIGRLGRGNRLDLLRPKNVKPISPIFADDYESDDIEKLDNP